MKFENSFDVDAPIDQVYEALMDVERVAPCVPGAQVLEQTGEDAYQVGIKVKVGPMSMLYKGTVEIVEREPEAHRALMRAKARESRGQGTADAHVQMALSSENGATHGTITTDVKLSGRAASMGRGVIQDVSGKLVDKFSENLAEMLSQPAPAAEPAGPATPTEPSPPPAEPAAAASAPSGDDDALEVGGLIGPIIASRLRDPRVLGGLGVLGAVLAFVLLRRRR